MNGNPSSATVVVGPRARARIEAGHPWVFEQDVERAPTADVRDGGPAVVWVTDARGRRLAAATWARGVRLPLRILSRVATAEAAATSLPDLLPLVRERLTAALARRRALELDRDAFRVVHAEADGLPGLFVDVYADAAVVQTTSVPMDALRDRVVELVHELLRPRVVIAREDSSMRDFEGLPRFARIAAGTGSATVVYRLGSNHFEADLLVDGKTGGFLDQADNHAAVAAAAAPGARALDAFAYHGGFALALARRGGDVLATDEDAQAAARLEANARRNQLPRLQTQRANAFDLLRTLEGAGERFDVVVLDPPAFAKRAGSLTSADRAYKEIFLRGLRLVRAGGVAALCSCSGQVTRAHFDELITSAAADAGRAVQIIARLGAGRDHPELVGVPETGHLKTWLLRVL